MHTFTFTATKILQDDYGDGDVDNKGVTMYTSMNESILIPHELKMVKRKTLNRKVYTVTHSSHPGAHGRYIKFNISLKFQSRHLFFLFPFK